MNVLSGKIALVTGASRGAGKGIALELAKAGAFVYVTGRTTDRDVDTGRPGTIDGTLKEIQDLGGDGASIRCDHTDDAQTQAAIERIGTEKGRLDILVNNVWGGNETEIDLKRFWEQPATERWEHMFTSGVRAQLMTNFHAVPLMRGSGREGLIVHTTFWDHDKYTGNFYYDLSKNALVRMAFGLSRELAGDKIAVVPVSPGWMRTELVLKAFGTDEEHWREIGELSGTESVHYVGRAVTALAADPEVMRKSGIPQQVGRLAAEYGFTDIDGRWVPPFMVTD